MGNYDLELKRQIIRNLRSRLKKLLEEYDQLLHKNGGEEDPKVVKVIRQYFADRDTRMRRLKLVKRNAV